MHSIRALLRAPLPYSVRIFGAQPSLLRPSSPSAALLRGVLLLASACALLAGPLLASAQNRGPDHIGAKAYHVDLVPLDAPPGEGNGTMYLGDVWEQNTIEQDVCNDEEEVAIQEDMQTCRRRFWDRYDPGGYARGLDLGGYVEECVAGGAQERRCVSQHQSMLDERMDGFMEDCFGSDACREDFERCDKIGDQCTRRYVEWDYYEHRNFTLPCRPFDYLDWEDKRVRDDWKGGRWGRIRKIDNRGFVGDPNPIKGLFGWEGKPMTVAVKEGATGPDGEPLEIGSYFFADWRYGRIAMTSLEEAAPIVKLTLPFEYKSAGFWRHGWVDHLFVCQETFTRGEIKDLYEQWGILPPGEDEEQDSGVE